MNAATAYIASTNHAANEWARTQAARTMVRAARNSNAGVYRRTWPPLEAIEPLGDAEYDPALRFNGFLDSTLALRDGLSVVEVFAPLDEPAALHEFAMMRGRA